MQTRAQKETLVKDLTQKLKDSKAVVFSDFKGLSVKDITSLRRELRAQKVDLSVMKKTLIGLALRDAGMDADTKTMEGQIAIAVSAEDEVVAAKIIAKMSKVNKNLKIVAGILGKQALSKEEVMALSKLPDKPELLAKLVGTLNAPISGFVNVLAGNIRGLVQVLKAISETRN